MVGGGREGRSGHQPLRRRNELPREDVPIERQDCSYVGTPSVQQPTLIRPCVEVAAKLRTLGWGVRGLVEDSTAWTARYVSRVSRPLHANGCTVGAS